MVRVGAIRYEGSALLLRSTVSREHDHVSSTTPPRLAFSLLLDERTRARVCVCSR